MRAIICKPAVRGLLFLVVAFDANGGMTEGEMEWIRLYSNSRTSPDLINRCKTVVPENATRYGAALVAWQKANELAIAKAEQAWREVCEKEKQACAEMEEKTFIPSREGRGLRAMTPSQRIEICNGKAARLEHEAAHGPPLNKEAFDKKYDVEEWPSGEQLTVNPFAYEDKVIGMVLFFGQMVSATEGTFRSDNREIVFSDIPKGLFTADNTNWGFENIVLAGRVLENKAVKTPTGGEVLVPYLKFIGVQFCYDFCSNYGYP